MRCCAHCGAPLEEDAAFCPTCGAPAEGQGSGTVQAGPAHTAPPRPDGPDPAQAPPQSPRQGHQRGPLAAGLVCLAAAIVAFVKPAIIPYSLPVGIALVVLGVLLLLIAAGRGKRPVIAAFLAAAILIPTVGEVSGLLPQGYKLVGSWRMVGESGLALMEFEGDRCTFSQDGEVVLSGTWTYEKDILTFHASPLQGGGTQRFYVTLMGDMMTVTELESNESAVLRRWS